MLPSTSSTALHPLSEWQERVQCSEASGPLRLGKASHEEGGGVSEHTQSSYGPIAAKEVNSLEQKLHQTAGQIL